MLKISKKGAESNADFMKEMCWNVMKNNEEVKVCLIRNDVK